MSTDIKTLDLSQLPDGDFNVLKKVVMDEYRARRKKKRHSHRKHVSGSGSGVKLFGLCAKCNSHMKQVCRNGRVPSEETKSGYYYERFLVCSRTACKTYVMKSEDIRWFPGREPAPRPEPVVRQPGPTELDPIEDSNPPWD